MKRQIAKALQNLGLDWLSYKIYPPEQMVADIVQKAYERMTPEQQDKADICLARIVEKCLNEKADS